MSPAPEGFSGTESKDPPPRVVNPPSTLTIGRIDELDAIVRALDGDSEDAVGAVITGALGVGKTHLARRAAEQWTKANPGGAVHRLSGADRATTWPQVSGGPADPLRPLIRVDDANLLEPEVTDRLVADARAGRIRLIITANRIDNGLSRLVRDGVLHHVHLDPFDRDETRALVEGTLDGAVSADVVWFIWSTSTGNPRYAIDLIASACADRHVVCTDGAWLLVNPQRPGSRLADLIRPDLSRLTAAERDVLDMVALGGVVPVGTLLESADADAIDALAERTTIRIVSDPVDGGTVVRASNRRFGEIAASLVSPARRRELFDRLYGERAFPSATVGPESATALVHRVDWAQSCAVHVPGEVLLDAALAASSLGLTAQAEQFTTHVLAAPHQAAESRIDALLLRAEARRFTGNTAAAHHDAEAALATLVEADLGTAQYVRLATEIALVRSGLAQFGRGNHDEAQALIGETLDEIDTRLSGLDATGDPETGGVARQLTDARDILTATCAMRLAYDGRFAEAVAAAPVPAVMARIPASPRLGLAVALVYAKAMRGDLESAKREAIELVAEATAAGRDAPWALLESQSAFAFAALWAGDLESVRALIAEADYDPDAPTFVDHAVRQLSWGILASARGDWGEAIRNYELAAARFRIVDFSGWLPLALTWLASAEAASGATAAAATHLAAARTLPLRSSGLLLYDVWDHWGRVCLTLGSPDAAKIATSLIERGRSGDLALVEAWGWHLLCLSDATQLGADSAARLDELEARLEGELPRARLAHTRSVLSGDPTTVASSVQRLTELGYWVPMRPQGSVATLSERQLEVARLAATGMASAAIAERLFISKRTVDAHLRSIYERTGVHRRSDLAAVLTASTGSR